MGQSSIPGWGTKILQAVWHNLKKKKQDILRESNERLLKNVQEDLQSVVILLFLLEKLSHKPKYHKNGRFSQSISPIKKGEPCQGGPEIRDRRTRRRDFNGDGMYTPLLALKTKEGTTRQGNLHL